MMLNLFPPQNLTVRLTGTGKALQADLTWSPPLRNASAVGGYLIERTTWWHGVPRISRILTGKPVRPCFFHDPAVVPDRINEYRVLAVHKKVGTVPPVASFPAAVYGFAYLRYPEIVAELRAMARKNPDICRLIDAGRASGEGYRIWCMVLGKDTSDNPDRPGVLLVGNPHASEVQGTDALMGVLRESIRLYRKGDPNLHRIIDHVQTRVIPLYNPHGRKAHEKGCPCGLRKTHPPALLPPPADPLEITYCWHADTSPGIDPNRTFDVEWAKATNACHHDPQSSCYPGKRPFAAPETQALVRMIRALRPQISIHYHGPCGASFYPGKWADGTPPPATDTALMVEVAREFAIRSAGAFSGEDPSRPCWPCRDGGLANRWCYQQYYGVHLLPEGFHEQLVVNHEILPITEQKSLEDLIPNNLDAFKWLGRRVLGAGLIVRVKDHRGQPLGAAVEVVGHMDKHCAPQHASRKHGTYRRLLIPGWYPVRVSHPGFRTAFFRKVLIRNGRSTILETVLVKVASKNRKAQS